MTFSVGKIVGKFFKFMKTANIEEDLYNTFDGRVSKKADVEDFIGCPGLSILHPYYEHILLLPVD